MISEDFITGMFQLIFLCNLAVQNILVNFGLNPVLTVIRKKLIIYCNALFCESKDKGYSNSVTEAIFMKRRDSC